MTYRSKFPWTADARIQTHRPAGENPPTGLKDKGSLSEMIRNALELAPPWQRGLVISYGTNFARMGMEEIHHAASLPDFPKRSR